MELNWTRTMRPWEKSGLTKTGGMVDGKASGEAVLGFTRGAFAGGRVGHQAFDAFAVGFEEAAEFLHRGQGDEVAGDEEFLIHAGGGEFHEGIAL